MEEARAAIDEGLAAVAEHPDIRFAGYLQDAQKEYAEARLTEVIVDGGGRSRRPTRSGSRTRRT
jgi:predicted translin family RNA/ssDNA-binding protein